MPSEAAVSLDVEFPNLARDVVEAYRNPPPGTVVEVIEGVLYTMTRPRPVHQSARGELYAGLSGPFRHGRGGPGGWVILPEPALCLGDRPDLAEPDLAGWRRARLAEAPSDATIRVVPDWVCEILSSSTRRHDLVVKMPMYFRHDVGHVWLIDPEARTLQAYRRVADGWLLALNAEGDDIVRVEPFDALDLDLGALWRW